MQKTILFNIILHYSYDKYIYILSILYFINMKVLSSFKYVAFGCFTFLLLTLWGLATQLLNESHVNSYSFL